MPKAGDKAIDFSLLDQDGQIHKLSDYAAEWFLLYFYPKDDTAGCTAEACSIRDNLPDFAKLKCQVIGVSADSIESHDKFARKYNLNFTILSDPDKKTIKDYGVWQEKSMYGKKYMGIARTSFLIDPAGKIAQVYEKVKPAEHADQVLEDLKNLTSK